MSKTKVSVIMPVYNARKFVGEAIESILSQTFIDFEFIIIDDGSADGSWQIVKDYASKDGRIKLFKNRKNLGTSKTLNRALHLSKADYVVRMDADDWSYPERIEEQFRFMEKHPEIGVSGGTIEICDDELKVINKREYPLTDTDVRKKIFLYSPFAHPATIWRANILKKVGGYNENIPVTQDYELYFRIGQVSKFANLNKILLKLRTHSDASSLLKRKSQERYVIYSRLKAFMELGYNMTMRDKLYTLLQVLSMELIPPRIEFWLFNFLRRQR